VGERCDVVPGGADRPARHPDAPTRAVVTRQRHGEDFYTRIGQASWALRQRVRAGDAAAAALLARRRQAREQRQQAWRDLLAAREAVTLLRDELASRARANADPARAVLEPCFAYSAALRRDLAAAEARLADLEALHAERQRLLGPLPPEPPDSAER
jgi:hypothetical protein